MIRVHYFLLNDYFSGHQKKLKRCTLQFTVFNIKNCINQNQKSFSYKLFIVISFKYKKPGLGTVHKSYKTVYIKSYSYTPKICIRVSLKNV